MPVDPTRHVPARRPQRKITEEEMKDIELKRIRGELSCAECRRLKLRCDKKVPCGSCQRRGCESICPCGILSAGQGTRFILADTEALHSKISEMSHRIRSLEDALAIFQTTVSSERHPLLRDELLKIKFGAESLRSDKKPLNQLEEQQQQSIDALGTLTLSDEGDIQYFGSSAGSESLMMAEEEEWSSSNEDDSESQPSLPSELQKLTNLFPFTANHHPSAYNPLNHDLYDSSNNNPVPNYDHLLDLLVSLLPSPERAWALCDSYVNHGAYFFRPMKKVDVLEHLLPSIYEAKKIRLASDNPSAALVTKVEEGGGDAFSLSSSAAPASSAEASPLSAGPSPSGSSTAATEDYPSPTSPSRTSRSTILNSSPHSLAMLFFIFALGALSDLNLPPYNAEAEYYFDIGRATLALRPVFDSPQVDTVQALGVMATYLSLTGKKHKRDSAWCVMSLASKLAQSIGLHRDSARWHMDSRTVEKRRLLFWEAFSADMSHSLALGRPPAIHLSYVDCEFPMDEEATLSDTGEIQSGFWRMKYTFARDLFMGVAETTLTAQSPSYTTVLNLDRKVRQLSFPASFKPYALREDGEAEFYSSSLSLRDFYASQHRTVTMLYLHRSFFAQAMLDHPNNPLLSPFAPSFLTAYRCASVIIRATAHHFERCAAMAMRTWFLLYHTFSAAVIVGTVVTRSPRLNIAQSALNELDLAVVLFEQTAPQSVRARIALGVLHKLQQKAHLARSTLGNNPGNPVDPSNQFGLPDTENGDDKLAIFGGQTRVVVSKKTRHKHSQSVHGSNSAGGGTGTGGSASQENSPSPTADGATSSPTSPSRGTNPKSGSQETSDDIVMAAIPASNAELAAAFGMDMNVDVHPSLQEYLNNGLFPPLYTANSFEVNQTSPASPSSVAPFAHSTSTSFGQARSSNVVGELPSTTRLQDGGTLEEMYATLIGLGNATASGPQEQPSASTSALPSPSSSSATRFTSVMPEPTNARNSTQIPPLFTQRQEPPTWSDSTWAQRRAHQQTRSLSGQSSQVSPTSHLLQSRAGRGLYSQRQSSQQPPTNGSHQSLQHQRHTSASQHVVNHAQAQPPPNHSFPALANVGERHVDGANAPGAFLTINGGNYGSYIQVVPGLTSSSGVFSIAASSTSRSDVTPTGVEPGVGTGVMVEMGLSTESGMDAAWLSFMRDCGIIESGGMGPMNNNFSGVGSAPFAGAGSGLGRDMYGAGATTGPQGSANGMGTGMRYGSMTGPAVGSGQLQTILAMRGRQGDPGPEGGVVKAG